MFKPNEPVEYFDEIIGVWKKSSYKKFAYGRHFMNDGSEVIYKYHIKKI